MDKAVEKLWPTGDFSRIRRIWLGISRFGLTRSVSAAMMTPFEASSVSGRDSICKAQAGKGRAGAGVAVRREHGRQAGSQEPAGRPGARRPAPGSGFRTSPDRHPRSETGSIPPGSRRPPPTSSKGRAIGKPLLGWERRIEPELSRSRRGIGTAPDRNEAPTGAAGRFGSTDRRQAIRGPGAGPGSAPVPDGRIVLRAVRPVASHSKPREVDRVPIREAARGFAALAGTGTLSRFAVARCDSSVADDTMARH